MSFTIFVSACRSPEKIPAPAADASVDAAVIVKEIAACDSLRAENIESEAKAREAARDCILEPAIVASSLDECRSTRSGITGFRLTRIEVGAAGAKCFAEATVALTHVDNAGVVADVPLGFVAKKNQPDNWANFSEALAEGWNRNGKPTFFDYDGDGEPEVLASNISSRPGDIDMAGGWHDAWTFRSGQWLKYPPLANVVFSNIEDFDQDGRPDLRTRGVYESVRHILPFDDDTKILDSIFLLHSRPDGTFSSDDEVAKRAVALECAQSAPLPLKKHPPFLLLNHFDARAIVCARLRGESEADAMKQLATTCKRYVEDPNDVTAGHCQIWVKQLAAVIPPFTIVQSIK